MIITIFGATGTVGKKLVSLGLNVGHTINAFGRNVFTASFPENSQLRLIKGALFDDQNVYDAILGCDAVLSAIGGAADGMDKTRSLGMVKIVTQMEKAGVKRIIAIGNRGILDSADGKMIIDSPTYPKEYLAVGKEHLEAFKTLRNSNLSWTVVAPSDIIDEDVTGTYHTEANKLPAINNNKVNAGDLALFMLTELERNQFIHQRVGISD